jgi:uncharacterized protein (DUF983 family)
MNYFPNRLTKTAPVDERWGPVTRSTRASAAGRVIKCPRCGAVHRVYHFSWSALQCLDCGSMVDKYSWSRRV